ncbi:MAG: hypothetical protein U0T11_05405 [Chitinophagaceae bacterium]
MRKIIIPIVFMHLISCSSQEKSPATGSFSTEGKQVYVYATADSTAYRLSLIDTLGFIDKAQPFEKEISVFIDPDQTYQTYVGIGAALTDASAETFAKLPASARQEFLTAHFDKQNGIGYTIARTNINSCDFSSDMYTYVKDGDKELKTFSIEHDLKYKIPLIKEAMKAAGGKLNLFASP